jgi:DNA polymerase III delta prime subunit
MSSFGQMLRRHRRQCRDEMRGGLLTQERLGEQLGYELGDTGYSGAAVSDWERDKSSIDKDDRLVLIGLVAVLHRQGGLASIGEADDLLLAGNYRPLNTAERKRAFPDYDELPESSSVGQQQRPLLTEPETPLVTVSAERQKQLILLQKAKNFWVKGVLEQSLKGAMLLDLAHEQKDDLIEHPWRQVVGQDALDSREQPAGQKRLEMFRHVDRALLILGAPGSGKTTTLLLLARDLINWSETHPTAPIPIILSLVSWAEKRESLVDWVVKELVAKYQIPSQIGREWLEKDALLLLLDGFDEVPARLRARCALAINQFRESHGFTGIVVCSRTDEYRSTGVKLKLGGAILLQPLTQAQVDAYLDTVASPMTGLRSAMQREGRLQETARTPLALSIMRMAFSDGGDEQISDLSVQQGELDAAADDPGRQLFSRYVERMFRRRILDAAYPPEKTRAWLAWLARQMVQHNQNMFFVEQIQPSWLPSRRWRWAYLLATRLITGFFGGIAMWLLLFLLKRILPDVPSGLSDLVGVLLPLSPPLVELLLFVLGNMILALLVALIQGVEFERRSGWEGEHPGGDRPGLRQLATIGLAVGVVTTAVLIPFGEPLLALAWGMTEAIAVMVLSRAVDGTHYRNEVRMVEALGWKWSSAIKGLLYALVMAVVAEAIEASLIGYNGMSRTVITFGLAGLLLGGLRGRWLQETAFPNQGVRLSIRNGVIAALAAAFSLGAVTLMIRGVTDALLMMLFMILFVGALYGGSNVIKHYVLRFSLWLAGKSPRDTVLFLDYSAGLVLVRKVGGGYIFTHRLLQEYFAEYVPAA